MKKEITATKAMAGRKIEYVLSGDLGLSGNIIKKLKATGGIMVNGDSAHTDRRLQEGDVLTLVFPSEKSDSIVPEEMELDIIYEDEDIFLVNKPFGMETHPSKESYTKTLANGVVHYFKGQAAFHVITRLDKDTTGVVLIAKNAVSAHRLSEAMREREIQKEYAAVVEGIPHNLQGTVTAPIKKAEGIRRVVAEDGKEAVTEYYVEKSDGSLSLIRLKPLTGRTHQIRVHLAYMGTPIYGDWLYGNERTGERLRLHCTKIEFKHPSTGADMVIKAPLPLDMAALVK